MSARRGRPPDFARGTSGSSSVHWASVRSFGYRCLGLYTRAGETVVLAVYAGSAAAGEPVAGDDLDAVGWFPLDALPELAFPHDARVIADWQARAGAPPGTGR